MSINNILISGDSHTYGDGLSDVGHDHPWKDFSTKSWPYYIFKPKQIKNKSYPGNCNDIISYTLARYIDEVKLVIIMFTYPERQHIIRKGYNFIASHNFNQSVSDNGNENWVGRQLAIKFEENNKKFVVEHHEDELLEIKYLKNILFCQSLCESKNINYYFTTVEHRPKFKNKNSVGKIRDALYSLIKWNKFFLIEKKYGFSDYAKLINAGKGTDNNHWCQDYHKMFGQLFKQYIEKDSKIKEYLL